MAVYQLDQITQRLSDLDYKRLIDDGFGINQIKKAMKKVIEYQDRKIEIGNTPCIHCGSDQMIQTGVCKTCIQCGETTSCS